jgi:hypothetical protein
MRPIAIVLAAAACLAPALAQQQPNFQPGEAVDYYTFGKWVPCTVSSALTAGTYGVRCGSLDFRAKPDARELRLHIAPPPNLAPNFGVETAPSRAALDESVGARYGTRDPRHCNRRPDHFTSAEARDVFICDSEHEFGGILYLVSDVTLVISPPRSFNPAYDAHKPGIDSTRPVFDIQATYNKFQCSALPASHMDNPNTRNCDEFHTTGAAGACFRNTAGEWHCVLVDATSVTVATAKSVSPPTLVE